MARGPCTFKQTDVTRAVKGAAKAARNIGLPVERVGVEFDPATGRLLSVTVGKLAEIAGGSTATDKNEWDELLDDAHQTEIR
jgi:hypothetical protein